MTVIGVSPSEIFTLTRAALSFTAITMDCWIASVLIGSYECANITTNSTGFQCTTPRIPFPGKYSVTIKFNDGSTLYTDEVIIVKSASSSTSAVIALRYLVDTTIYTFQALINLLAELAAVGVSSIIEIDHTIIPISKRSDLVFTEEHDVRLSIIASDQTSATEIAERLLGSIPTHTANFTGIGVQMLDYAVTATCDSTGECECTPNYAPPLCEDKVTCPNNCTSNGECVDGPLGRTCSCNDGYIGRDCSTLTCVNACSGHGSCLLQAGSPPLCQCNSGWKGEICNESLPCDKNCSNHGQCIGGQCVCQSGWTGSDCSSVANAVVGDNQNQQQKDNTVLWVVIAIVGAIFLVAVGLVVYVVIERRRG